jgi:tetratricopeptide (TPR) repeat protein
MRNAAARRLLRAAVFADPGHPLAAMAYLELGNDEASLGKLDEAVQWYERLVSETERAPQISLAFFNLGLVQRARKDYGAARRAFYRVVDRDPAHELACRAYVQIGWTHLLEGQLADALFPLRRALGIAPASPSHPEAAVTLATALLLNGDAREANTVMASNQEQVNREPWRTTAAFLDALARFRVAVEAKNARLESGDLLAALLAFQKRPALGPHGQLLAGRAFQDLAMTQQMAKVYDKALATATGLVAEEMTFGLAEYHLGEGKKEPALKALQSLAGLQKSKWTLAAKFRLATIAQQDGQFQQCLQVCTALLKEEGGVDRAAVFQLLGSAYEQLGDYPRAARCFAGQLPD